MFDKVIFNAKIDFLRDAERLADRNHLQMCTESSEIYYQSSAYGNFEGIFMQIRGNRAQIKCSLHKLYSHYNGCGFDNTGEFTISQAKQTITTLFEQIGIDQSSVKVTYYEIGLNLIMSQEPINYIESCISVGTEKELWNDANFKKHRQKTSEKSRTIKKVFKIYDKAFEQLEKRRPIDENVMRIETIYKRQSIDVSDLFNPSCISKILKRFYNDWLSVEFPNVLRSDKGIKASQEEKARCILKYGRERYYQMNKSAFKDKSITKKQWETVRTFISEWDELKKKFRFEPDNKEIEYKHVLKSAFDKAIQ